ncbi:MAG TPA: DAK2 domain-containing protein [Candidatus Dormibacteraeota bacterium]|nr:DAK2 domain-containing protein [Candidatus Dormibacteraeota bacterium]
MAAADAAASGAPLVVTGRSLRQGLERALGRLAEQKSHINELNVFPVPDGDTGTNMHLTLEAAWREVSQLPEEAPISAVTKAAAHGSLMGARGNSGVILSQVLRGWSVGAEEKESLDARGLSEALAEGSRVAYLAVKRPVEGTILSVARDAARAARKSLDQGGDLTQLAEAVVAEGWAAVERSRDQMDVLREAGVVDAGGFGLAVILTAVAERLTGREPEVAALRPDAARGGAYGSTVVGLRGAAAAVAPEGGFGYCTEFVLVGAELEAVEVRSRLGDDAEDDSALVVGERGLLHVHLHAKEPWELLTKAAQMGKIERLKVDDMTSQHHDAQVRGGLPTPIAAVLPLGVVTVAQGEGFRELLMGLGAAVVVEGGQSQNPSTEQILQGIESSGAEEVLLLPNNSNLVLGAEQAAAISLKEAAVVPSHNLPQGIAALLAFDPRSPLEVNRYRMERAMEGVHAIEVTRAVRDSQMGAQKVPQGALIGLLDGKLVSCGTEIDQVVLEALGELPKGSVEVVTLYRGADVETEASERLARAIKAHFPGLEVDRHDGGQALYQFIISAE